MPPRAPPFESKHSQNFPAAYLDNLRNHRPARPTGSRPAPFAARNYDLSTSYTSLTRSDSAPVVTSYQEASVQDEPTYEHDLPTVHKSVSFSSVSTTKGRPLAQPPNNEQPVVRGRKVSPTAIVQIPPSVEQGLYVESISRQLEKEEAHSLREALDLIDHKDEERRIYDAAQDEAADLVWRHQNPHAAEIEKAAPFRNPDLRFKDRRRNSGTRQVSGSSKVSFPTAENKIYEEPEEIEEGLSKAVQAPKKELPLRLKSGNSLPWLRKKHADTPPAILKPEGENFDQFEIHKNPPTQSRNAGYTANTPPRISPIEEVDTPNSTGTLEIRSEDIRAATSMKRKDRSPNLPTPIAVSDQLGRPIVSFDPSWKPPSDSPRTSQDVDRPVIKLAESPTAIRFSERPLPRPTPIVPEVTISAPAPPAITVQMDRSGPATSAPAIPTICLPDEGPGIPEIKVEEDCSASSLPTIKLPDEKKPNRKHVSTHSTVTPIQSTVHKTPSSRLPWLSRASMPTVSCSSCTLPIAGRVVTASGSSTTSAKARFHPECFTCHHCSTALECVSFYPEPDASRTARILEFGFPLDTPEGASAIANDPLRFYCHLDFHELFSPRCRSCKTPIEGEVIVAAGGEWHVGHFFCAECGEPFDSTTPFVERDNYAYCVSCHTKRTSARCRECKLPILDELTVEALGGKYHEKCFVCIECGGGFGEEGRFFVRDVDVCPTEKELRKGITRKVEEKAVCGPCEERRLKA